MNASDYDECACGNAKAVRADRCIACYAAERDREHGTRSCYAAGCRLPECREANAAYNRRRRAGRGDHDDRRG